ncbi:hypothetical protein GGI03_003256 [Coemansia sp. RSA 2337]|nr:hypothetical protein H4S04_006640 [Coemansia sp. S16]KAJ2063666.1 hypothetical protein GGI08_002500 [Coemansia sp. S2]KAJ2105147.1 hypothetical protein IW146_008353 [Coemansia sp. RSA 922]KAJ2350725.1 hypothetical protein GGH92_002214 [Coemansia sp. RSA 2673]KAJ2464393.1 hypothetical protein GGI03_003256 [Coemansia sp. RSA 2337]
MLNHTQDGVAPGVPEPSRTQEPEMARTASSQESDSGGRVVVRQAQAIAALEQRIMALERKVAKIKPAYIDQPRTIATLERTNDALRQSLIGQQQTGISHDQILATFSHALVTSQQATTTHQQTINVQQQTITEQRFQLEKQARRIDASNLLLARATPLNVPAFAAPAAGAPTFDDALAVGAPTFDVSPAIGIPALDISAFVAPAAGATTFGNAPAVGVSAVDYSAFAAPAAGALAADVPTVDLSAFAAPAVGALAADYSAFAAPAVGALAADVPTVDLSAFAAPAAGALAADYSAFAAPASGALAVNVPAINVPVDAAQAAAIPNADESTGCHVAAQEWVHSTPRNDAPESSQAAKRRRLDMRVSDSITAANTSRTVYDVSGEQVTSERLLVALGEVPFVSLGYVFDAYRHIYGCDLTTRTIPSQECIKMLARVVALEHWTPQLVGVDPVRVARLNILCRRDLEIGALRQGFLEELGLTEDPHATVLGPRLCYVIFRMCRMAFDLLTGAILSSMFLDVTRLDLHSLTVVTEQCVWYITPNKLCLMVEDWVFNFGKFFAEDNNSVDDTRCAAKRCNDVYATRCSSNSRVPRDIVGARMLKNDEDDSKLFLGNQAANFDNISKRLFFVASTNTSPLIKVGLGQLAMPLRVQPSSS